MIFDTIYDQIFTVIETTFPDKFELINPYVIEDNNELYLKNGYGVEIGPMVTTESFARQIRQFTRVINISFTKRVLSSDKITSVRRASEKSLVSDQLALVVALKNNIAADLVEFVSDDSVEVVSAEQDQFLWLRTSFNINYNEQVR